MPPVATPCQEEPTVCYIFATKIFCKNLKSLCGRRLAVVDWHVANVNVVSSSLITRFFYAPMAYDDMSCQFMSTLDKLGSYNSIIAFRTSSAYRQNQPSFLPCDDISCQLKPKVCYIFATQPMFCQIFLWVFLVVFLDVLDHQKIHK